MAAKHIPLRKQLTDIGIEGVRVGKFLIKQTDLQAEKPNSRRIVAAG